MNKLLVIFLIILVWQKVSFAEVFFVANDDIPAKKPLIKQHDQKKNKINTTSNKIEQYQIEGYADSKYVRFVVDIANKKIVSGQMFKNGKTEYVHGELLDDVLHLYGQAGEHFTVIIPK